jgi:phosphate:Na+ symporter
LEAELIIKMLVSVIGGLGLFLFGMKNMSEGMQAVAGEKLRKLISTVTDNRFVACGVGATVTGLIQSSSVTTVMVVGMVNASIMSLKQAIGVIMGADIGTTVTAWLIALKIADYGLPILGISAFFYLFSKNERMRYTAMMLVGLGMVFFGLELMKNGFQPLRNQPEFLALFSQFIPDNYWGLLKCIAVGAFTTAIVQSSSATVGITIALATAGVIGYETAVALVLGENIGTTITAYLASLGAAANAKRAAFAHISIKVFGVLLLIPVFYQYIWLLKILPVSMTISQKIAFAHSGFNILIVSVFIGLVKPLARFVTLLVPGKAHEEISRLTYLDNRMVETPAIAIQQSYQEIIRMGRSVQKMFDWLRTFLASQNNDEKIEKKIFHREQVLDLIQKEVVEFISRLMTGRVAQNVTEEARSQLRMADEYESLSDYIEGTLKLLLRMKNDKLDFTEQGRMEIVTLHDSVAEYLNYVHKAVEERNGDVLGKALTQHKSITHKVKQFRTEHLNRLAAEQTTPMMSIIYMDLLNSFRRMRDHILNIAEVLAGEK